MKNRIRTFSRDSELVALRRRQIAQCAAQVFVKQGYHETTVRDIADTCALAIGTIYHYIGSKEDILYLVINHVMAWYTNFFDAIVPQLESKSAIEALEHAMREFYRGIDESQDFTLFIYQETKNLQSTYRQSVLDAERRLVALFRSLLQRGCETGEFKIDNITLVAHDIVVAGEMWAVRRWFLREYVTVEEYTKHHVERSLSYAGHDLC